MLFVKTFLFFNFYKDDVITNLADTVPGNNVFIFASEKTAEFTGARNNQGINASCGTVKFQVNGTTEAFAGTGINDFFLSKLTKSHKNTVFINI